MINHLRVLAVALAVSSAPRARAASLDKAGMLDRHGLVADAKRELIDVTFGADPKAKPQALYLLGSIEFRENNGCSGSSTDR